MATTYEIKVTIGSETEYRWAKSLWSAEAIAAFFVDNGYDVVLSVINPAIFRESDTDFDFAFSEETC